MFNMLLNIIHTEAPLRNWYTGRNLFHGQDIFFTENEKFFA